MAGLLDIASQTQVVHGIEVTGISARGIAVLLERFPTLRAAIVGRDVSVEELTRIAPDAISAIIAAGCGHPGNPEAEAIADRLSIEVQFDLLEAILRATLPGGWGPFAARLASMSQAMGVQAAGADAASTKAPASTLPSPSSKSSKRVTRPI